MGRFHLDFFNFFTFFFCGFRFALKMASSLRNVDWAGVWNLCQEEKRHRRERRPERVDGKAAQQMPSGASAKEGEEEEGTVPSSYHQLTPKKKTPQARDGESPKYDRITVSSRHQAMTESNEDFQVLRNAEETQERERRSSSRATTCMKAPATNTNSGKSAAEVGWVKVEDIRIDVMDTSNDIRGGDGEEDRETVAKLSSEAGEKDIHADQSTDADAVKEKENGQETLEEIKAISRHYDDGVKGSVRTEEREETSCSQREMGAGIEVEPTTAESTLTNTANEDDNDASETETIDKCTQVTYCALHKTFLTLRAQSSDTRGPSVATVENEEDGTEDDIVKAEDDGYGEAKEGEDANETREETKGAQSSTTHKRRLKRRMALLAASIGNSILSNRRRNARKTPTVVEETKG